MGAFIDITNKRFGNLIAIKPAEKRSKDGSILWHCICDCTRYTCPKNILVSDNSLRQGSSTSCAMQQHSKAIHPAIRKYFTNMRSGATKRGYTFELTLEQFREIIQQSCFYCDANSDIKIIVSPRSGSWRLHANGIDRINNNENYTTENCVPCCAACNRAKMDMSSDTYIARCKRVASKFN